MVDFHKIKIHRHENFLRVQRRQKTSSLSGNIRGWMRREEFSGVWLQFACFDVYGKSITEGFSMKKSS